ncbi:hypothetical protein SAMN05444266_102431 [Chitinophaga jiangningensis]|uniref:Uncharacterized protein n=1 Tax=Chitinophaga jiangningensis TaxID=1419482 RepID=A0A1M6YPW5_9BACT|nr:hypothetical protein SAMN05444266_102431 [Chitinophaga jiangningensis]
MYKSKRLMHFASVVFYLPMRVDCFDLIAMTPSVSLEGIRAARAVMLIWMNCYDNASFLKL